MKRFKRGWLFIILACLQLTVCFGCGSSDKSDKKETHSESIGFDTSDEALNAYLNAFLENDSEKIESMIYEEEWDVISEYLADGSYTKKRQIKLLRKYMDEIAVEKLTRHSLKEWKPVNNGYEDDTDYFLSSMDNDKAAKAYQKIGFEKSITYDWAVLSHEESNDFVECIEDDVSLMKFNGKWYLSALMLCYIYD